MTLDPGATPIDDPLAYFLTWTTYGTWLPGDERGWVEKPGRFRPPSEIRESAARRRMTEPELSLSHEQRRIVEATVRDHCQIRHWHLHAVNCRTEHVHVVVTASRHSPDAALGEFKSWCTRKLKESDPSTTRTKWWSQDGSKRQLFTEAALFAAIKYVVEDQTGSRFEPSS